MDYLPERSLRLEIADRAALDELAVQCVRAGVPYDPLRRCLAALANEEATGSEHAGLESTIVNAFIDVRFAHPESKIGTAAHAHRTYLAAIDVERAMHERLYDALETDREDAAAIASDPERLVAFLELYEEDVRSYDTAQLTEAIDRMMDRATTRLHELEALYARTKTAGARGAYRFEIPDTYVAGPVLVPDSGNFPVM